MTPTNHPRRRTFARINELAFRLRAASALIGVNAATMRTYEESVGMKVRRANEITPGAPQVRVFNAENLFDIAAWRRRKGHKTRYPEGLRPQIITVYVAKGGTAKTTTAVETAMHLQLLGLRVLLIDLDFQANATALMGYESDLIIKDAAAFDVAAEAIVEHTFSDVIGPFLERVQRTTARADRKDLTHDQIVKKPFGRNGPHLIPADTYLVDAETALSHARGHRELLIKKLLAASLAGETPYFRAADYDVIMFDCAPSVNFLSSMAITASDYVVAPIRLDSFSMKGLNRLNTELQIFAEDYDATPELIILPTHNIPQLPRVARMQEQLTIFHANLAPMQISASEEFPKSLELYMPLCMQKPLCNATVEYQKFAEFLREKMIGNAATGGRK